ncbi:MAG: hypothetical protein Q8807_03185 ['Waltheria sp.' little leaf phytoplasma]|nr:hypothetical protein ['Waltheria sp.' little leaf phytoplasma]
MLNFKAAAAKKLEAAKKMELKGAAKNELSFEDIKDLIKDEFKEMRRERHLLELKALDATLVVVGKLLLKEKGRKVRLIVDIERDDVETPMEHLDDWESFKMMKNNPELWGKDQKQLLLKSKASWEKYFEEKPKFHKLHRETNGAADLYAASSYSEDKKET